MKKCMVKKKRGVKHRRARKSAKIRVYFHVKEKSRKKIIEPHREQRLQREEISLENRRALSALFD